METSAPSHVCMVSSFVMVTVDGDCPRPDVTMRAT
jgi:hypothetical protein